MSTATLHSEKKKNLVPKLRFQEFEGEWKQKKLGEVSIFLDGRRKPIKSDDRSKMKGEYPYYGASGIIDYVNKYIFDEELILLGEDGENIISRNSPLAFRVSGKCWINNHAHVIVPKANTNIDFLTHNLERINYVVYNTGTAQPKLNQEVCKNIPSWFPPLPEQQKIASFLSAVDEKIQQLSRKKELLEQYKKGIMQQLFSGKLRFKDENGKDYPDWEEKKLGDISALLKDGSHGSHKDVLDGKHYLLSAKNILNGRINYNEDDRKISEGDFKSIYKNYSLEENDILLTIVGTIGRVAKYKGEKNISFQRSVAFFRFKNIYTDYIFQLMNGDAFQKELDTRKVVSAQPGIYLGDLAKIAVNIPCIPEQQKIANFLSSIDAKIESVNQQIAQTQMFKKGLLQQMFV